MTIKLTPNDLKIEMDRYRQPLGTLRETPHEWGLGVWTLSKFTTTWRIGWGHELRETAMWVTYPFTWFGAKFVGVVFDSGGDDPEWYMAGWERDYNTVPAERVVAFLNAEIADRRAGIVSKYNGRIGLAEDRRKEMYDYEDEVESRRANSFKPLDLDPLPEGWEKEREETIRRQEAKASGSNRTPDLPADVEKQR